MIKIVTINIFINIFVIVNEILTIVNNIINKQYKYFNVSVIFIKQPEIVKININQPKKPIITKNVLLKWYAKLLIEIIA
jgi:hypothetical protein